MALLISTEFHNWRDVHVDTEQFLKIQLILVMPCNASPYTNYSSRETTVRAVRDTFYPASWGVGK